VSNVPAVLPKARPRGGRTLLVVLLLAAIYAGYARALDGELQFDDLRGIAQNELIKNPRRFLEPGMLTRIHALTDLTAALNYRVSGLAVRPYHLVNLALHLGAVVVALALALLLLRRIDWPAPFATAWLAAALFGLHPMQTEAVSYIYQRAEVLASLFYLLGLLLALTAEERGTAWRWGAAAAGSLLAFTLAWMAKPVAVTFPALLVLCTLAFPPPDSPRAIRRTAWTLPFWVMAAVFAAQLLTGPLRGNPEGGFSVPTMSPLRYFLTQPRVVLTYLRLLLWPAGQNVDWEFAPSESLLEPPTVLAFAALAALILVALWLWRRGDGGEQLAARIGAFGIFWFLIFLAPTSSFVPLPDVIAEHRTYLASFGLSFAAAAAGVQVAHRFGRRGLFVASAVALAACVALGVALERRNAVWESAVALWTDVVAKSPGKARGHMNLGFALVETAPARALAELEVAERLAAEGDRGVLLDELEQNIAGALLGLRRYPEAIARLEKVAARHTSAPVLTNLAIAYLQTGELEKARVLASRAAEGWPRYGPAHHTLGEVQLLRHDPAGALAHFQRAVEVDPDSAPSLGSLALTQQELGDRAGACASWARYSRTGAPGADEKGARVMAALQCGAR
jgi:tetratricopeptide (TPR) repeat protein